MTTCIFKHDVKMKFTADVDPNIVFSCAVLFFQFVLQTCHLVAYCCISKNSTATVLNSRSHECVFTKKGEKDFGPGIKWFELY